MRPRPSVTPVETDTSGRRRTQWIMAAMVFAACAVAAVFVMRSAVPNAVPLREGEQGVRAADVAEAVAQAQAKAAKGTLTRRPRTAINRETTYTTPPTVRQLHAKPRWHPERIAKLSAPDNPKFVIDQPSTDSTKGVGDYNNEVRSIEPKMLLVHTRPPRMTVKMDGRLIGSSPLMVPLAAKTESARVEITGQGYRPQTVVATPNKLNIFTVSVDMSPLSKPAKAAQPAQTAQ